MFQTTQSKFQRGRLIFLVMAICLFWFALEVNLFHLQVISHDEFERIADNQYIKNIEIPAQRGTIFDRNGNVMATNVMAAAKSFVIDLLVIDLLVHASSCS